MLDFIYWSCRYPLHGAEVLQQDAGAALLIVFHWLKQSVLTPDSIRFLLNSRRSHTFSDWIKMDTNTCVFYKMKRIVIVYKCDLHEDQITLNEQFMQKPMKLPLEGSSMHDMLSCYAWESVKPCNPFTEGRTSLSSMGGKAMTALHLTDRSSYSSKSFISLFRAALKTQKAIRVPSCIHIHSITLTFLCDSCWCINVKRY